MVRQEVTIINTTGLHLRPAGIFCNVASRYKSKITCEIANVNKKNFSNMCLSIRQIKIDDLKWIEIINLKKADEN